MKITTQNELAALLAGVYLGHDLGLCEEMSDASTLTLGNCDDTLARIHCGHDIEPISYDSSRGHYAVRGALVEAERRAVELWQQWQKVETTGAQHEG